MQQLITTNKASILAVLLPEDANTITPNGRELFYWIGNKPFVISLPDAYYNKSLGFAKDLTEEKAAQLIDSVWFDKEETILLYMNYIGGTFGKISAQKSLSTLLQANKCYLENPYGDDPLRQEYYEFTFEQWEEAESRTGNWFILIEMKGGTV